MALSIFAFASTSAARQSLNPAPVLSRKDPKSVVSSDLLRFLRSRSLTLLPQNLDGLIDICVRFHKRRAAIAESRPGPLAQRSEERRVFRSVAISAQPQPDPSSAESRWPYRYLRSLPQAPRGNR